ncbi:MAG: DUF692 domain-containing protein [Proteobacteria bacterium]|nr:MAG: DUF692 domain-containing protein [Pseudomonadota bacterium]
MTHPYGLGLALRQPHLSLFTESPPPLVKWVEVISENYFPLPGEGWGRSSALDSLKKVRSHLPVSLHGVSLSLGSASGLNRDSLKQLKTLCEHIEPFQVSDHLCWTGLNGVNSHDLLPLPYTGEAIDRVCRSIDEAQTELGRPLLIENLSSYVTFQNSEMTEWEFLKTISNRTGCQILLDVNNVYVSSVNHRFDPLEYLRSLPESAVSEIHLAGHMRNDSILVDTHDAPVAAEVWLLYEQTLEFFGRRNTCLERDAKIPDWHEMETELKQIQVRYDA